uniref:Uncharacterized protein n=1 Tax=Glossina palpalis gambiensis TaxID=67801 RepID=A0A1B0B5N2_9MUSC
MHLVLKELLTFQTVRSKAFCASKHLIVTNNICNEYLNMFIIILKLTKEIAVHVGFIFCLAIFIEYCTQFHLIQPKLGLAHIPNSVHKWNSEDNERHLALSPTIANSVKGHRNRRCDNVDVVLGCDDSDVMLSGFDCIFPLCVVGDIFIALQMISSILLGSGSIDFVDIHHLILASSLIVLSHKIN